MEVSWTDTYQYAYYQWDGHEHNLNIFKTGTVEQATVAFRKGYERCGEEEANDAVRIACARAAYDTFSGRDVEYSIEKIEPASSVADMGSAGGAGLDQIGEPLLHHGFEFAGLIGTGKSDLKLALGIEAGLHDGDLFLVRTVAHFLTVDGEGVLQGLVHVHAEREVHTALEVEAEVDAVFHEGAEGRVPDEGQVGQGVGQHHEQNHEGYGKA